MAEWKILVENWSFIQMLGVSLGNSLMSGVGLETSTHYVWPHHRKENQVGDSGKIQQNTERAVFQTY